MTLSPAATSPPSIFSPFLSHRFVKQYKGPIDIDLVRMLEAEVVDHSPNVCWDSIAGLECHHHSLSM